MKNLKKIFKSIFSIGLLFLVIVTINFGLSLFKEDKISNNVNKKTQYIEKNNKLNNTKNDTSNYKEKTGEKIDENTDLKKSMQGEQESNNENEKNRFQNIVISFVGDCTIGRDDKYGFEYSLPYVLEKNKYDYSYFFKNVKNIFEEDDLTVANLESVFTNENIRSKKAFNFKAPPDYVKILNLGDIEIVNIANNHTLDYLEKGLQDTKKTLDEANVDYFGYEKSLVKEFDGIKVALLGYKVFDYNKSFLKKLKKNISELKSQNYLVIINFHWGIEGDYYPYDTQEYVARYSIDNGADLIIGHHPHVIQSVEFYKNKPIFYSLGNFCFGGNKNPKDKDTMIVQVRYNYTDKKLDSYDFRIIPCRVSSVDYINDYCPTPLSGNDKERVLKKINDISKNSNIKLSDQFQNITQ